MTDPGVDPVHPAYEVRRAVTRTAAVVLAANPSEMTLAGTNTWLVGLPGRDEVVVIDPGPDDRVHLTAVLAAAGPVVQILLTHGHPDHSAGARALHQRTGAPVRALDPRWRLGGEGLHEGDVVAAAGVELRVRATPGHTADSLSFVLEGPDEDDRAVLTGDTVLGRGSSVIAEPDGDLGDYLASLRRLAALAPARVLPGHGPDLPDIGAAAAAYLAHRHERLAQVRAALAELGLEPDPANIAAVTDTVYGEVARALRPAAEQSVRAQLSYLKRTA